MNSSMFDCADCGINTKDNNEYYMVKSPIWFQAISAEPVTSFGVLLCIGCLEKRLNRKLTVEDFANVPCNLDKDHFHKSERLKDRLKGYKYNPLLESDVWGPFEMREHNVWRY
jgi:hypothetical protein